MSVDSGKNFAVGSECYEYSERNSQISSGEFSQEQSLVLRSKYHSWDARFKATRSSRIEIPSQSK